MGFPPPSDDVVLGQIGEPTDVFLANLLPAGVKPAAVRERFSTLDRMTVRTHGELFDGVRPMLKQLAEIGHTLSICSNGSIDYINTVLEKTGIKELFTYVVSAKYNTSKADCVARAFDLSQPSVFIGDTAADIDAGKENRIATIAALYGYGQKSNLSGATFEARTPGDIGPLINRIAVYETVSDCLVRKGRRIIGINGVDASGKTTFTAELARYVESIGYTCQIISIDDFHNPLVQRRQGKTEIDAYYNNAFNYERLIDEVLHPLKKTGQVHRDIMCLDLDTDTYTAHRRIDIDADTVVLVEGVLLLRPPLLAYLDGTVFLDVKFEEVLERARVRDVPKYGEAFLSKYIDKYIPVQKRYVEAFKPDERCDILIDNNDYCTPHIIRTV